MIEIENIEVFGFETAIRGMRNPLNSWDKSDSFFGCKDEGPCCDCCEHGCWGRYASYVVGKNDLALMKKLARAGSDHRKFLRMINLTMDIVAPLYWWKEFDTYKVGTVANSCSTMHKIHDKEFTLADFSCEHLIHNEHVPCRVFSARQSLLVQMEILNTYRELYIETIEKIKNAADSGEEKRLKLLAKKYWWQMIQLLPSSYNQRRTVQLNYETLLNMYFARKNHKLDEWQRFCAEIETLPYFKEICREV